MASTLESTETVTPFSPSSDVQKPIYGKRLPGKCTKMILTICEVYHCCWENAVAHVNFGKSLKSQLHADESSRIVTEQS